MRYLRSLAALGLLALLSQNPARSQSTHQEDREFISLYADIKKFEEAGKQENSEELHYATSGPAAGKKFRERVARLAERYGFGVDGPADIYIFTCGEHVVAEFEHPMSFAFEELFFRYYNILEGARRYYASPSKNGFIITKKKDLKGSEAFNLHPVSETTFHDMYEAISLYRRQQNEISMKDSWEIEKRECVKNQLISIARDLARLAYYDGDVWGFLSVRTPRRADRIIVEGSKYFQMGVENEKYFSLSIAPNGKYYLWTKNKNFDNLPLERVGGKIEFAK